MLAKIYSAAVYGVDAYEVEIEVNGAGGDPVIVIVGLPDAAVKESRDRVTTAISNSGYYWPRGRTTINLAPADIKKEGPSFDLPIALGMIAVTEELDSSPFENFSFVGELALNGSVRPVKGVLPVALEARRRGKRALFVPEANALEAAMVARDTVERLIEFSTSEVFGTYAFRVDETSATTQGSVGEARWTYAVSKLAGEHMAHAYHQEYGLPTVSVRPFNVYGPGQIGGGAIRAFIEAALAGQDLTIHGDGSQIRAWCYVDDMVEGLLLALEHENAVGESFNIGNARSAVTIFDLARRIKTLSGCPGELVFQPIHYLDVELRIPNVDKARTLLGFEPKVELDEGLEKTIAWYRAKSPTSV